MECADRDVAKLELRNEKNVFAYLWYTMAAQKENDMDRHFYVDPAEIARRRGLRVVEMHGLEGGVNGLIQKMDDGSIEIHYDGTMHPHRQRFTIAHELGHFVKGHLQDQPLFRDPSKNFTLDNYDIHEVEANNFAADLLMPKEKIDFLLYTEGITSVPKMASLLRVSEAAMTYRLRNMGYIS